MARPKAARENPRPTALTIKGRPEWRAWVERAAAFCRTDATKLVDAALVEYLKQRGFDEPAPSAEQSRQSLAAWRALTERRAARLR